MMKKLNCFVDLHLHLDGAISMASARELGRLQGIPVPASDDELAGLLRVSEHCSGLNEFLEKFAFPCSLLQTAEGLRLAVANLLRELRAQGLMYAEIRFAPQLHTQKGMTQEEAVCAAIAGLRDAPIPALLILCCMRGKDNAAQNMETVDVAAKYLGQGVCAVDLAGAEGLFPTETFADVFTHARALNVPYTIHAGEADGPESVRAALRFGAVRIGHGVRAAEDSALVRELAEKQIPLELCPTSNVLTAIYHDLTEYPLKALQDAGVWVTINSDDPVVENTTLPQEYEKLEQYFHLSEEEIRELLRQSVRASFADEALKRELLDKID